MYFDPAFSWLVALMTDGIVIYGEKTKGRTTQGDNQKKAKQLNKMLNGDIRLVKESCGLSLPELALDQIKNHFRTTQNAFTSQRISGTIILDVDNQNYIIELLSACEKEYRIKAYKNQSVKEYHLKAESYKNAVAQAKQSKAKQAKELEAASAREAQYSEQETLTTAIFAMIAVVVFLLAFLLSQ